jgi:hypothetical protein
VKRQLVVRGKLHLEHNGLWCLSQVLSESVSKKRLESRIEAADRLLDGADDKVA